MTVTGCLERADQISQTGTLGTTVDSLSFVLIKTNPTDAKGTTGTQAWSTFIRNHAHTILACDFLVVVTATFRMMYIVLVLEIGTRRILH